MLRQLQLQYKHRSCHPSHHTQDQHRANFEPPLLSKTRNTPAITRRGVSSDLVYTARTDRRFETTKTPLFPEVSSSWVVFFWVGGGEWGVGGAVEQIRQYSLNHLPCRLRHKHHNHLPSSYWRCNPAEGYGASLILFRQASFCPPPFFCVWVGQRSKTRTAGVEVWHICRPGELGFYLPSTFIFSFILQSTLSRSIFDIFAFSQNY